MILVPPAAPCEYEVDEEVLTAGSTEEAALFGPAWPERARLLDEGAIVRSLRDPDENAVLLRIDVGFIVVA